MIDEYSGTTGKHTVYVRNFADDFAKHDWLISMLLAAVITFVFKLAMFHY